MLLVYARMAREGKFMPHRFLTEKRTASCAFMGERKCRSCITFHLMCGRYPPAERQVFQHEPGMGSKAGEQRAQHRENDIEHGGAKFGGRW